MGLRWHQSCLEEAELHLLLTPPFMHLQDRKMELLELWKVALSPDAAAQLDLRRYLTNSMVCVSSPGNCAWDTSAQLSAFRAPSMCTELCSCVLGPCLHSSATSWPYEWLSCALCSLLQQPWRMCIAHARSCSPANDCSGSIASCTA